MSNQTALYTISESEHNKRSRPQQQIGAPPELRFVSQPKGIQLSQTQSYVFDETGGQGVSVYVFDSGANMANPEIYGMRGNMTWLWPRNMTPFPKTDESGHGSCIVSKIAGPTFGVAKSANIVMVKAFHKTWAEVTPSRFLESFGRIFEDVRDRKMQRKAVVNISFGSRSLPTSLLNAWKKTIMYLLKNDVVVVVASGNDRVRYTIDITTIPLTIRKYISDVIDSYPGLFKQELSNLIVVGSVNIDGSLSNFSQGGDLMDFSAPGSLDNNTGIQCASGSSADWIRDRGTSLAAPAVSGLAAYLISIHPELQEKGMKGMVAQMVKDYIKSLAWSRNGGPIAIWNNESYVPPSCNKRQVIGCSTGWSDSFSTVASGVLSAQPIFTTESLAPSSTPPLASSSSSASSASLQNTRSTSSTASSYAASTSEPAYNFSCDNTSLEDGDGICTCSGALIGTSTTTFTPPGGPGNVCPTYPPSKKPVGSTAAGSSTTTPQQPPQLQQSQRQHAQPWPTLLILSLPFGQTTLQTVGTL